ncbi:MAG: PAS domain S-box protein [Candidatus Zixiibacteriota bacterium]
MRDITNEKQAKIELEDSEEKYRILAENSSDLVTMFKGYQLIYVSPSIETILGYSPEEFLELEHTELFHPDDKARIIEKMKNRIDNRITGSTKYIYRQKHKDGNYRWLETIVSSSMVEDDELISILNTRDITKLKETELKLKNNQDTIVRKLKSILVPDTEITYLKLEDVLDIDKIQSMMNEFYELTNIGIAIVDNDGKILVKTGWQKICTEFHRVHPVTNKRCIESDTLLSNDLKEGEVRQYKCKNNMWDIATPIFIGDKRLGAIFLGQFFYDDETINHKFFENQAEEFGFDKEQYLKALEEVPRWSHRKVETVFDFYRQFAMMVSEINLSNIKLAKTVSERDRLLSSLKESEERFRLIIEKSADSIFMHDMEGRIVLFNENSYKSLGYTEQELKGLNVSDIDPFIEIDDHRKKYWKSLKIGDASIIESMHKRKDGSKFTVEVNLTKIILDEKEHIIGFARNIEDRKRAEEKLKESEKRYKVLFENAPDAIYINDLRGRFVDGNRKAEELLGYSKEELINKDFRQTGILPPKYLMKAVKNLAKNVLNKPTGPDEFTIISKDGGLVNTEIRTFPIRLEDERVVMGIARDNTKRKQAEEELRKSQRNLKHFINSSPDMYFLKNMKREYVLVNKATMDYFQLPENKIIGKTDFELMPEYAAMNCMKSDNEAIDTKNIAINIENAGDRILETRKIPIIEKGEVTGLAGIIRDITETRKAQKSLDKERKYYRDFLDSLSDWAWEMDLNGIHTYSNPAVKDLLGYDIDEIVGYPTQKLWPDFAKTKSQEDKLVKALEEGKSWKGYHAHFIHKNGQVKVFESTAIPIFDDDGKLKGYRGIDRDITQRKIQQEQLREEKMKLDALMNYSPVSIILFNREGKLSYANKQASKMLDIIRDEYYNITYDASKWDIKDFDGNSIEELPFDKTRRTLKPDIGTELYIMGTNKKRLKLSVNTAPLFDAENNFDGAVSVIMDITEQRETLENLKNRLKYEVALYQITSNLFFTDSKDESINKCLEILLDVTGVGRVYIFKNEYVEGKGICMAQKYEACADGVEPEIDNPDLQEVPYNEGFQRWQEKLSNGDPIVGIVRDFPTLEKEVLESQDIKSILVLPIFVKSEFHAFIGFDETKYERIWHEDNVRLLQTSAEMIGQFIDRTLSEDKLKESEERFRKLSNLTFEGIILHKNGLIIDVNESLLKMMGIERDEIVGKNAIKSFVPQEYHKLITENIQKRYAEPYEIAMKIKDGKVVPIEIIGRDIIDEGETLRVAAIRDITDRKKAEKERQKLENQLRQAQKMETIGTLAGGIAHDFNNLLTPIIGYAEMVLLDIPEDSILGEGITQIQKSAEKARDLVKQLLIFSRKFDEFKEIVLLNELIENDIKLLRASIPTTISLKVLVPEQDINIYADESQINQIIMNLATNAYQAMKKGGRLTIKLESVNLEDENIPIATEYQKGQYARLSFSDTGSGIPKEIQDRIFEPFYTTKEAGDGTGLGLSVVHGIVKAHRGLIFVDSEIDKGTTFTIYLPESKGKIKPKKQADKKIHKGKGRILLVDDISENITIFSAILEKLDYEVISTTDSQEALQIFKKQTNKIDLVLSDITMPGLTGIELAAVIKDIDSDMPVVLMTGYSDEITTDIMKRNKINGAILKPINMSKLSKVLKDVLSNDDIG